MAVLITDNQGNEKTYAKGVKIGHDGHGDVVVYDSSDNIVATRKRSTVQETEVVDD